MDLADYLKILELQSCRRRWHEGDYLFRQGQVGTSLFIIVEGEVELIAEREDAEHVEAVLCAGHFLGEKALVSGASHQRLFSARARTGAQGLELTPDDLKRLEEKAPAVLSDMLRRSFQISSERLGRMNFLVRILRSSNNEERLVNCIRYFCRSIGKRSAEGVEISLPLESVQYYIDMEPALISQSLTRLIENGLLVPLKSDRYLVRDENALLRATAGKPKAA